LYVSVVARVLNDMDKNDKKISISLKIVRKSRSFAERLRNHLPGYS
jgi:hypothetical protein